MFFDFKKNKFICQQEYSDCGVICLLNVIQFYGGDIKIEKLRELSGTSRKGTSFLGLYQASLKSGFDSEGLKVGIDYLKSIDSPCILHVVIDNVQHFLICYSFDGSEFIIGDPRTGIEKYTIEKLNEIWTSKSALILKPNGSFKKKLFIRKEKRQWFLNLIKEDSGVLIFISTLSLIVNFMGLSIVIFLQKLIDKILPHADKPKLILGLTLLCCLLIIRGLLGYLRGYFLNFQNRDFNNRLIDKFYSSLLYLPKTFFSNRKIGELTARMEDTLRVQSVLAFIFGDLVKDIMLVLVSLGVVFYYSTFIGFLMLSTIPVFLLIAYWFHDKVVTQQYDVMAANAKKSSFYINTLQGIDTIKIHNNEYNFSLINKLIYGVFQDKIFKLGKLSINIQIIGDLITVIIIIVVLSISSFMVLSKQLLIGELAAIFSIVGSMLPSIGNIAFANIKIQGAKVAFERMYEFTSIEPEPKYGGKNANEISTDIENFNPELKKEENIENFHNLKVSNLSFRFPGHKQLFKKISIEVEKGKISALIGESGQGKTTFFHILSKFYHPETGIITFNSIPYDELSTFDWRNILGVVPQEINIFNGNVLENVCLGATEEEFNKIYDFCKQYGFDKYFNSFSHSYGTILGEEGVNLSGGQKQLIALARALYKKPQLLLLDEPTSAMDRNTERFVIELLNKLKDQIGILIITHRISLAKFANIIYILEDGSIITKGSHDELMLTSNLYSDSIKEFGVLL